MITSVVIVACLFATFLAGTVCLSENPGINADEGAGDARVDESTVSITQQDESAADNAFEKLEIIADDAVFDGTDYQAGVVLASTVEGSSSDELLYELERESGLNGFTIIHKTNNRISIGLPDELAVADAIVLLERMPGVEAAQPNFVYRTQGDEGSSTTTDLVATELFSQNLATQAGKLTVSDPFVSSQWALDAMRLAQAWKIAKDAGAISDSPTGVKRTVAVIDEGFLDDHEDMGAIVDRYNSYNASIGLNSGSLAEISPIQSDGHGTHVAGVVGARTNNGIGIAGVSYNAQLQLIKAATDFNGVGSFTSDSLTSGIEHVIATAPTYNTRVINISVGGQVSSFSAFDKALTGAIDRAFEQGIVVVASSGNSGSGFSVPYINYPSDYPTAVSVISLEEAENGKDKYKRSTTSNYNMSADDWNKDVSAPGVSIYSLSRYSGVRYSYLSGTSIAAPQVAGVLSLMFAVNPSLTADKAVGILFSTASDLNAAQNRSGTTFDSETGYGLVDAENAVSTALSLRSGEGNSGNGTVAPTPMPEPVGESTTAKGPASITRIYGQTALDTMKKIVLAGWSSSSVVVLATANGYWDGLSANGVAGLASAPIVLTDGSSLSKQAYDVMRVLKPRKIIVCGGTLAISDAVVNTAAAAAGTSPIICRLWGQEADDTAYKIYQQGALATGGSWSTTAFICTDNGYWDALSVAPISYSKHMPIILTRNAGSQLSSQAIAAMKQGGIKRVYIIGGECAVRPFVVTQLKSNGISVVNRIWGVTAIDTSAEVAKFALEQGLTINELGVATNSGYWDALAGAAYCGRKGSALIIVDGPTATTISGFVKPYKTAVSKINIFGGPLAVSDATERALKNVLK